MLQGYKFAGTQYTNWCFCGDKYDTLGLATNCDMKCAGNPNQICGGGWANSVYEVPASEFNLPFAVGNKASVMLDYVLFKFHYCSIS